MLEVSKFSEGGYRYIKGVFQYSAGVAAEPGFAIERALLTKPLPLAEGFDVIERHLGSLGRPISAFAACELRSPEPFSETGFVEFNRQYVQTLDRWGLYRGGDNPVARTNVCPSSTRPESPSLYAFLVHPPVEGESGGFIVAGSGETEEGRATTGTRSFGSGETSRMPCGEKMRFVVDAMDARLKALGFDWPAVTQFGVYTIHDVGALVADELVANGVSPRRVHLALLPTSVVDIEFEMDLGGAVREIVL
ncbi:MAG: hypothetical protein R2845_10245 [Thermomicrobiales bacterium]